MKKLFKRLLKLSIQDVKNFLISLFLSLVIIAGSLFIAISTKRILIDYTALSERVIQYTLPLTFVIVAFLCSRFLKGKGV